MRSETRLTPLLFSITLKRISDLSRHTAPRLNISWVVFQPCVSLIAPLADARSSYFSERASVTAASASAGEMRRSSCPRSPRVRWYASFRHPALEITTRKSRGRIGLRPEREIVVPCGVKGQTCDQGFNFDQLSPKFAFIPDMKTEKKFNKMTFGALLPGMRRSVFAFNFKVLYKS